MKCSDDTEVFAPAEESSVSEAESRLGVSFPKSLKALYTETDGVLMNYGASTVMPVKELVQENIAMRDPEQFGDLYMPFEHLLLIGHAGNGDLWAFGVLMDGTINDLNIYGWDHETDARPWVASGLDDLLMRVGVGILVDAANT